MHGRHPAFLRLLLSALALCALLIVPASALAAETADQNTLPGTPTNGEVVGDAMTVTKGAQTFLAGRTGTLGRVDLMAQGNAFTSTVKVSLQTVTNNQPTGTELASEVVNITAFPHSGTQPADHLTTIRFSNPAIVAAGQSYAIVLTATSYGLVWHAATGRYADGQGCRVIYAGPNYSCYGMSTYDFGLVTYTSTLDPVVTDRDGDGVADDADNCPDASNADQADADGDENGNVCDSDRDGDGIVNDSDNCADTVNPGQDNGDNDGLGDACDADRDNDGVANGADNCADTSNADQADSDADGMGDACDADRDADGVPNDSDNCVSLSNAGQSDLDGDAIGDVCDSDRDGDTVANAADNCADVVNTDQGDRDRDGAGNACDTEDAGAKAIGDLLGKVDGLAVHTGTKNSLGAKLRNALSAYNAGDAAGGCDLLASFLSEVRAQSGKKLTVAQAAALTADATAIRSAIGC